MRTSIPGSRSARRWAVGASLPSSQAPQSSSRRRPPVSLMDTSSMSMAPSPRRSDRIIVVMGVSSSGKSTVGAALAERLGVPFLDGDGYHPPANVEKMRAGIPLTDTDRWPWLERLSLALKEAAGQHGLAVGACSAL